MVRAMALLVTLRVVEPGLAVVSAGEVGDTFYIIVSGECQVVKPDSAIKGWEWKVREGGFRV